LLTQNTTFSTVGIDLFEGRHSASERTIGFVSSLWSREIIRCFVNKPSTKVWFGGFRVISDARNVSVNWPDRMRFAPKRCRDD